MNIPYAKHDITEDDIQSVVASLRSGFLTGGQCLARFEEKFSTYVGSLYSLGVSSGTAGLHLAVEALVKPESAGKTVLVPSMTFAATANAVIYSGLKVEFVDIDAQTLLIDIKLVEEKLAANTTKNQLMVNLFF
ncbi:MAG: aminotransferase class I/II-fold pyridoxal phosphate-dependent enzyme [Candidatus Saccharibacteria bacterium]